MRRQLKHTSGALLDCSPMGLFAQAKFFLSSILTFPSLITRAKIVESLSCGCMGSARCTAQESYSLADKSWQCAKRLSLEELVTTDSLKKSDFCKQLIFNV